MTTEIIEVNNLLPVSSIDREAFFLSKNENVKKVIDVIKKHYSSIAFEGMDGSTAEGRKELKKIAADLNSKIKAIDEAGMEVKRQLLKKPNLIDETRTYIESQLKLLYEEIRKPAVEYEKKQAKLKADAAAKIAEEHRKQAVELAQLKAEKEQREREEQIKLKAAEDAKQAIEQRALIAEQAAIKAKEDAKAEVEQIKQEAAQKEQLRKAEEKRKSDAEAKRLADIEHVRAVKNKAFNCLIQNGIDRDIAISVIKLISENKIENVSIKY